MPLKCLSCGHQNMAYLLHFDIENSLGHHERLYLLQCDACRNFSIVIHEDAWMIREEVFEYYLGPFSRQDAESIFAVLTLCRNYKDCECEIHQAVFDWLDPYGKRISLLSRQDLLSRAKSDPRYLERRQAWEQAILPPGEE